MQIDTIAELRSRVLEASRDFLVDQESLVDHYLISLLSWGHLLLVGPPGVAKSRSAWFFSKAFGLPFQRVQFTADLLPSDIVGAEVYNPQSRAFEIKKGPIFANFVLADELNRAPPKVQSALLEAMQERQVTLANQTMPLPVPFFVAATMNPYDGVGTYALPDASIDRFLLSLELGYPSYQTELRILETHGNEDENVPSLTTIEQILEIRHFIDTKVFVDPKIHRYIARILERVRSDDGSVLDHGVSTRAAIGLLQAAKVYACLEGRDFVIPEDIKLLAHSVLRHRIRLSYDSKAKGIDVKGYIESILSVIPVDDATKD